MKAFLLDHVLDFILGFGLSSTTHPAWPGFDFEQARWSAIETDETLLSCRKDDDRQK